LPVAVRGAAWPGQPRLHQLPWPGLGGCPVFKSARLAARR